MRMEFTALESSHFPVLENIESPNSLCANKYCDGHDKKTLVIPSRVAFVVELHEAKIIFFLYLRTETNHIHVADFNLTFFFSC